MTSFSRSLQINLRINLDGTHPNCRVQKILSQYLTELTEELKRIQRIEQDDDILKNIIYLVELIAHMGIS